MRADYRGKLFSCPSVTRRYCVETAKHVIELFHNTILGVTESMTCEMLHRH